MAKKKSDGIPSDVINEDLASLLANTLNTKFKETNYKVAYFLDRDADSPSNVTDWISTGNDIVDLAISNRPNGGLPVGRIIEIMGESAAGKSLLTASILAQCQRKGGLSIYIDTENAVANDFFEMLGMDLSKMIYAPVETIEDAFSIVETIIEKVRQADKDRLVCIAIDSIMGATTKVEQEADYEKDGFATTKAIVLSKAMRKITNMIGRQKICLVLTNQLRDKVGVMGFGEKTQTSGGKAVGFHSSVRLTLYNLGMIKTSDGSIVGAKTKLKIKKNRLGPPSREVEYDIYFDSGIDSAPSWIDVLVKYKLVKKRGAYYDYVDIETGEEIVFTSANILTKFKENPKLKKQVYERLCEVYIMKYDPSNPDEELELITSPDGGDDF
jgi:recombination protein RecA